MMFLRANRPAEIGVSDFRSKMHRESYPLLSDTTNAQRVIYDGRFDGSVKKKKKKSITDDDRRRSGQIRSAGFIDNHLAGVH